MIECTYCIPNHVLDGFFTSNCKAQGQVLDRFRSGPKLRDLDLGYTLNLVCQPPHSTTTSKLFWVIYQSKPDFKPCPIDLCIHDGIQDDTQHDF